MHRRAVLVLSCAVARLRPLPPKRWSSVRPNSSCCAVSVVSFPAAQPTRSSCRSIWSSVGCRSTRPNTRTCSMASS
uniref:Putative secreted protein n=1 Tax=Anopheles darlingi TaxID=43151 RepID=A0A2M4DNK9_ANODA